MAGSEGILYGLRDEHIFLNVDDPSTDPWIWTSTNQLVFETRDIDHDGITIRCVRNFLLPYDKVLRAAGVLPVLHPQSPTYSIGESESVTLRSIRTGFNELRKKGLWTDVKFVVDNDNDTFASPLVAHRSFLSVFSDFFSDSFCEGFSEAKDASSSDPVMFPAKRPEGDYHSAHCVRLLLGVLPLLAVYLIPDVP